MPKSKVYPGFAEAVADVPDGSVVGFGGFAVVGMPINLYKALADQGAKDLTCVSNSTRGGATLPADAIGNLRFRRSQRNFNPLMAMAARVTVVEVEEDILPVGAIDPDDVHLSGIFVHRLVKIPPPPEGWWPQRPA